MAENDNHYNGNPGMDSMDDMNNMNGTNNMNSMNNLNNSNNMKNQANNVDIGQQPVIPLPTPEMGGPVYPGDMDEEIAALEAENRALAMVYASELEGGVEHVRERQVLTPQNIL